MSKIQKIENHLKDSKYSEHIINGIKAILANFPVGSGIASLMSDYIPSQRELRLMEFTENIARDLSELKEEINENYLRSDEYAFIFEKCFKGAVESYQKEKIIAFRAVLVNSLIDVEKTQTEKEYYLNLVDNLSLLHIQVLSFLAFPRKYLELNGLDDSIVSGGFGTFFPKVIPDANVEIIKLAFKDLYNYGFTNTDSSIFHTMTASSGWSLLGNRVSENGRNFINFISLQ
ncbi:hypothetical protein [Xanthovirga aplysinae]|uniref:hypothetical protein n=1 Tax=Xanthovirga aplysinae TaxID=2529853 RepID=UPI0012BC30C5|nr:hypothetical protein [Xanthovirga aplysinae]MTI29343.1 hypothetical protein [Xanthovirga aplysinae]